METESIVDLLLCWSFSTVLEPNIDCVKVNQRYRMFSGHVSAQTSDKGTYNTSKEHIYASSPPYAIYRIHYSCKSSMNKAYWLSKKLKDQQYPQFPL